ncbi:hypothetical protein [Desulfobacterium sp. N47]|uniref:Uncharacterized protein n=1 Tax=uncultured Desulfobacterium sp. TaxID=201089 RepID=E1YJC6_9BACT|nr:unknown protein [uncultured Desulfobacterium sp.]
MDKKTLKPDTSKTRETDSTSWKYYQQHPDTSKDYYGGLPSEEEMRQYTGTRMPQRGIWSVVWSDARRLGILQMATISSRSGIF